LNQRPSGYEPDELPDCSIPHQQICRIHQLKLLDYKLVRKGGLEPPRPKALPPQGSVSTNSTTTAAGRILSFPFLKRKLILHFLVQLVKFQAMLQVQFVCFAPILGYMHHWFAA
jgi:hypothetical protein